MLHRLAQPVLFAGIAMIVLGLAKLHAEANDYDLTGSDRFAWSIAFAALLAVAAYGSGLPDVVRGRQRTLATAAAAAAQGAIAVSLVQLFVGDALLPRAVVLGSSVAVVPWYVLCAAAATGGRAVAEERDRVFVVGAASEVETLRAELAGRPERPAQICGAASLETLVAGPASPGLSELVEEARASVLVLSRESQAEERVVHEAAALHEKGVRVRTLARFHEEWLGKLPVSELERVSLMFDIREVHRAAYIRLARIFDIVLSVLGTVALLVVLPFVLVGNLIGNRGPLFYRQPRVGKHGVPFAIIKFRTMRLEDGRLLNEWTTRDDPRITPFGRLLRTSHLDELPQVLNILKGDLSVVGPRPEQPHYVAELVEKIPFYDLRHLVRPGLTGWAQVKYGYAGDESDALEKLQYEFYYLRHQGVALDFRIVGRTIRSVLGRRGR